MENKKIIVVIALIIIVVGAIIFCSNVKKDKEENTNQEETVSTENFVVKYLGVDVTPGKAFDENAIDEENEYYEIVSCAFDGYDKVYTYSGVEITASEIDGVDTVYSVYYKDDSVETEEGLKITDTKESMISIYGEDYENELENKYTYTLDNVILSIIVENDVITSIEYTLKV